MHPCFWLFSPLLTILSAPLTPSSTTKASLKSSSLRQTICRPTFPPRTKTQITGHAKNPLSVRLLPHLCVPLRLLKDLASLKHPEALKDPASLNQPEAIKDLASLKDPASLKNLPKEPLKALFQMKGSPPMTAPLHLQHLLLIATRVQIPTIRIHRFANSRFLAGKMRASIANLMPLSSSSSPPLSDSNSPLLPNKPSPNLAIRNSRLSRTFNKVIVIKVSETVQTPSSFIHRISLGSNNTQSRTDSLTS